MRLSIIALFVLLAPVGLSQSPEPEKSYPFPGVALGADAPSIVALATDPRVLVGVHPLTTKRPAVVDGDTIRVEGLKPSLRLVGLDTEETFKDKGRHLLASRDWKEYLRVIYAGTKENRPPKYGSPMGEAAKDFAERFFKGVKTVHLEVDHPTRRRGYFGRHLVHVLVKKGGRWVNFNVEMVRQGLSPYFTKYGACHRHDVAFRKAEAEARQAGRGLWAKPPPYPAYPDYPIRLRWWKERERDIARLTKLRTGRTDLYLLGEDAEWKRLEKAVGKTVWVAGTPGSLRRVKSLGLQALGHRRGSDFMIAGPYEKVKKLGLAAQEGNLVMIQGTVSLHRKRPQFRLETVKVWKRVPKDAPARND